MKKRLLLMALFAAFTYVVNAQAFKEINGKKVYFVHVLFEFEGKMKNSATIDYGYSKNMKARGKNTEKITDENGNVLYFNSKLALIDYMTLQGWTYMDSTEEIFKDTYWSTFAKEVTDEEVKEILPQLYTTESGQDTKKK